MPNYSGAWNLSSVGNALGLGLWPVAGAGGNLNRVLKGGEEASATVTYFTTTTQANSVEFGDLTLGSTPQVKSGSVFGNVTRSLWAANQNASFVYENIIEYFTYNTLGNGSDFGDLTVNMWTPYGGGFGSDTRGIQAGGFISAAPNKTNVASYVTYATTGNATDFGDLWSVLNSGSAQSNSTRGVYVGGRGGGPSYPATNVMGYVTIATTGNFTDFGDTLSPNLYFMSANNMCDGTRAVFGGGANSTVGSTNAIQYYTMATTGNASDFGDCLSAASDQRTGAGQDNVSGFMCGGYTNTIQKLTIQTTGNTIDWADIGLGSVEWRGNASSSNCGGFG